MKKIISFLSLICISSILLTSCSFQPKSKNPERPNDMLMKETSEHDLTSTDYGAPVLDNAKCSLYLNPKTTDIKVRVKSTGYEWTSTNNYNGQSVTGQIFTMNYSTLSGGIKTMSSSADSVDKGQFKITKPDAKTVKVQYSLGDVQLDVLCPTAISPARFKKFLKKMNEEQQAIIKGYYYLIDFNSQEFKVRLPEEIEQWKINYPLAANTPWYYPSAPFSDEQKKEIGEIFSSVGYTRDDLAIDNRNVALQKSIKEEFNVSIYYSLDGDELSVKIPENEIFHPKDFSIENIQLLPEFGSVSSAVNGYYLLPDGSGSIMNFFNGKDSLRNDSLYISLYGVDRSRFVDTKTAYNNQAIFPVFGVNVAGQNGMFGIVEDGESFAGIEAHTGDKDKAPTIWPEFRINEKDRLKSFTRSKDSSETYSLYQFQRYLGDLKVRYKFLTGEQSSYSGMAAYYSNYLFGDRKQNGAKPYAATIQMVGVIDVRKNLFGITYNSKAVLTTFDEAANIAKDLKSSGMSSINLKLSGWFGGGYRTGLIKNISVESLAGGKKGFENLATTLNNEGISLYPDADVQYAYGNEGKPSNQNIASYITKRPARLYEYNPVTFTLMSSVPRYILTPEAVTNNINNLIKGYDKLNIKNVSFRYIGQDVLANYKEKNFAERQTVLKSLVTDISNVKSKGYKIMGSTGDAPFVKYLDVINDMPVESDNFDKTDYSVPFTAMVLSGYVDYTYKPINLSNSEPTDLLKLIESGAGANFIITGQKYDKLSSSDYNYLYSTYYDDIKDNVKAIFKKLQNAEKDIYGVKMVKHERLAEGVYKSTFANGNYVVVNYGDSAYNYAGSSVKAKDFISGKEGAGVEK